MGVSHADSVEDVFYLEEITTVIISKNKNFWDCGRKYLKIRNSLKKDKRVSPRSVEMALEYFYNYRLCICKFVRTKINEIIEISDT